MNGRMLKSGLAVLALATLGTGSLMAGDDGETADATGRQFVVRAELIGFQEVPAISTVARGTFLAVVDTVANTITYKLTLRRARGHGDAGARALRPGERERRHQLLPVHQRG